jgi:hypothetical protein
MSLKGLGEALAVVPDALLRDKNRLHEGLAGKMWWKTGRQQQSIDMNICTQVKRETMLKAYSSWDWYVSPTFRKPNIPTLCLISNDKF